MNNAALQYNRFVDQYEDLLTLMEDLHLSPGEMDMLSDVLWVTASLMRTNGGEAHLFGLEPNYGCCTANFNQAWPKFALSAFMHSGDTVLSAIPVPSALKACVFMPAE